MKTTTFQHIALWAMFIGAFGLTSCDKNDEPTPKPEETKGARENLPAEMAIGHLQAGRTYVVSSQTDGVPRKQSMAQADIFQAL